MSGREAQVDKRSLPSPPTVWSTGVVVLRDLRCLVSLAAPPQPALGLGGTWT